MKKIVAIALVATMVVGCVVGCGKKKEVVVEAETEPVVEEEAEGSLKIGLICLHDENSTYDKNFIDAFNSACETHNVEGIIKTNIPESNECYEAAADLVDRGCNIIFADSFGHENFIMQAAQEYPNVQFCHATGTMAHTAEISNYHNAFASIYEGRFLAGVAAGLKLRDMLDTMDAEVAPKVGYVSAFQYAECISGYTAWFLGVRSVVPEVEMEVISTGSWYDEALEKEAANKLISNGCVLISGHADSNGIPTACQEAGVPFTFYNGDISKMYPDTCIVSTKIDWEPYFDYIISCLKAGEAIDVDWVGTLANGSVKLTEINEKIAAEDTKHDIESYTEDIINGKVKVFDTGMFKVNGEELTSYLADVNTDPAYEGDTEVIKDGYFHESEFRSAPYFDLQVDGITVLTEE